MSNDQRLLVTFTWYPMVSEKMVYQLHVRDHRDPRDPTIQMDGKYVKSHNEFHHLPNFYLLSTINNG